MRGELCPRRGQQSREGGFEGQKGRMLSEVAHLGLGRKRRQDSWRSLGILISCYHVLPCIMHTLLPKFLREKAGCTLYRGSTNSISI